MSPFDEIERLSPSYAVTGKKGWLGYVTFYFAETDKVLSECPIEGNAIYVFRERDWRRLTKHSKGWVRTRIRSWYKKVVHKGLWIDRVIDALNDDE